MYVCCVCDIASGCSLKRFSGIRVYHNIEQLAPSFADSLQMEMQLELQLELFLALFL